MTQLRSNADAMHAEPGPAERCAIAIAAKQHALRKGVRRRRSECVRSACAARRQRMLDAVATLSRGA
jgi:hypothetical protein